MLLPVGRVGGFLEGPVESRILPDLRSHRRHNQVPLRHEQTHIYQTQTKIKTTKSNLRIIENP